MSRSSKKLAVSGAPAADSKRSFDTKRQRSGHTFFPTSFVNKLVDQIEPYKHVLQEHFVSIHCNLIILIFYCYMYCNVLIHSVYVPTYTFTCSCFYFSCTVGEFISSSVLSGFAYSLSPSRPLLCLSSCPRQLQHC